MRMEAGLVKVGFRVVYRMVDDFGAWPVVSACVEYCWHQLFTELEASIKQSNRVV